MAVGNPDEFWIEKKISQSQNRGDLYTTLLLD
jgi:hypothetical protein